MSEEPLRQTLFRTRLSLFFFCACFALFSAIEPPIAQAQNNSAGLAGTVVDPAGRVVQDAAVLVKTETSVVGRSTTDQEGKFKFAGIPTGTYTVEVSARGFALMSRPYVRVANEQPADLSITLSVGAVNEAITVEANTSDSIAAQLAPMDALLEARSARTEVTPTFIQNFSSPVSDFSELLQMAPGTFSVNSNGVGLGDSKTFFRGFSDGNYDISFDGIPFYDTNDPTHHSWAFFPSPWIGSIDFDRSPGTASTTGPTPFGGTINMLSHELAANQSVRGSVTYGSFNTLLVDAAYDSGALFGNKKSNLFIDVHRLTSDGYQTFNYQTRNAGSLKYQYKFSDTNVLTGYSGVVMLDSNTPNAKGPTRGQVAQFGDNFLLSNDPTSPLWYQYYTYHVPTDVEYVNWKKQFGKGWQIDFRPYTLSYYNEQYYNNSITTVNATSAVDKLNSYRKYGESFVASQISKFGIFRTGLWYEWATTNRYQIPSDPRNRLDAALPNFHERFYTNTYQPYAEYEFHATSKFTLTAGLKYAFYNQDLEQFADNGKTVGSLNGAASISHSAGYSAYLPSFDGNYRITNNWSFYGQFATGTKVPPSSVFDVKNAAVTILPKPTGVKTYQTGTVLKLKRLTLNASAYYAHFQNAYSSSPDPNSPTATQYTASGDSATKGIEGEANIYLTHGLSVYTNATMGRARYVTLGLPNRDLWVARTPSNTEAIGFTYQQKYFDLGVFHKRVGPMWDDNTAVNGTTVNQVIPYDPFNVTNVFFNYTIRKGSQLDQTKFRLSVNNLFDNHNITSLTQAAKGNVYLPGAGDTLGLMPGRSVSLTVTLGYSPKGR
jgi:iron complex outermembrane receptor protein